MCYDCSNQSDAMGAPSRISRPPDPQRPSVVSEYAAACLNALVDGGCAGWLSLGGAFALSHYLDYRPTQDVDAWWADFVSQDQRSHVIGTLIDALRPYGEVSTRSWGDVCSVELKRLGRKVFSFDIARRSALLAEPTTGPWRGILIDSMDDLVASKMVALVERGAPRDFRDIYALCDSGLFGVDGCWELWGKRQELSGDNADENRARLAIRSHLARIEKARALDTIPDRGERERARKLREWFISDFLHGL